MRQIEKFLSPFVESQFPEFYKEQGPLLILLLEEYFKWLEINDSNYAQYSDALINGNPIYHIRRLLEYRDVDRTSDEFLVYIKEKYLKNFSIDSTVSQRKLIKAAHDIYKSKGSQRSLELLFNLAYGVKIEIFSPGDYVLKPSDGTWVIPKYLELSQSPRNVTFVGKQVTGSISGATAFIEHLITRNINGKFIDIAFISNLDGDFATGELVTDNGIIENAPKIVGSLTTIDLTTSGELFTVGEIVNIVSSSGVEGYARVAAVSDVTGIVRFSIIDGGWGYSNTANTLVSQKVITYNNRSNANGVNYRNFNQFETISQNLYSLSLNNVVGTLTTNSYFRNGDNSTPSLSLSVAVTQNTASTPNTATLVLNQISANVSSNTIVYHLNKALIAANNNTIFTIGDTLVQRNSSTNNVLGVVDSVSNVTIINIDTGTLGSNGLHTGTYLQQTNTGAAGYIVAFPRENLFTHTNVNIVAVGSVSGNAFNSTSTINVYSDSTKTTILEQVDPTASVEGKLYELINTNFTSNTRWSTSNTAIKVGSPSINAVILIASDVGGKVASCTDVTATGTNIGIDSSPYGDSGSIGLVDINNQFYSTGATIIRGLSTNTFANSVALFGGQNADFSVGSLVDSETIRVSSTRISSNNDGPGSSSVKFKDMLISGANSTYGNIAGVYIQSPGTGYSNTDVVLFAGGNTSSGFEAGNGSIVTDASGSIVTVNITSNVGSFIVTTPTVSVVNASGGATTGSNASIIPTFRLGFVKLPAGTIENRLQDLLSFNSLTIGTIASLSSVNPGENYTADPFVTVVEPDVAAYGARDMIVYSTAVTYNINEIVEQTIGRPSLTLTVNNYSTGTNTNFEVGELVTCNTTGNGVILASTFDVLSNTFSVNIVNENNVFGGSDFAANTSITGATSGFTGTITTRTTNTSSSYAKGRIVAKLFGNSTRAVHSIKRISLFSNFTRTRTSSNVTYGPLIGKTSGQSANILLTGVTGNIAGNNAIISGNVIASNGSISSLEVIDSGFGYNDDENITIISSDGLRAATGKTNIVKQGSSQGRYTSTRGFLDDVIKLHDGDYYQNFSYEIQTSLPFSQYSELVKEVVHVAGKKIFGLVNITAEANCSIDISSSISIT
jgi:hypothetical protein